MSMARTDQQQVDDLDLFEQSMLVMVDLFGKEMTALLWRTYRMALRDVPEHIMPRAVDHLLRTIEMFPRPAEIVQAARQVMEPDELRVYEDIQSLRDALTKGMIPVNWTPTKLRAMRLALGMGEPRYSDTEHLLRMRQANRLPADEPLDPAIAGPTERYLLHGGYRLVGTP